MKIKLSPIDYLIEVIWVECIRQRMAKNENIIIRWQQDELSHFRRIIKKN